MTEENEVDMQQQPSPVDVLKGIYIKLLNNNPKSLASSLYQHVLDVCDHLKPLENEWMKYHYSKGYVDGINDFKEELKQHNTDDTTRIEHQDS
jgi:hypothetical protein